jgi:uncharacterized hydrophobic protein (TIGR00341 family)
MALQLVDVYLPDDTTGVGEDLDSIKITERWDIPLRGDAHLVRFLLDTEHTEPLLELLHNQFGDRDEIRILVLDIAATLPSAADEPDASPPDNAPDENEIRTGRISREELYQDVNDAIDVTVVHYAFVVLSTIVAAGGLLRDNVAIVIGAMVIAPLIGPNIALALATTLGDWELFKRSTRINLIGLFFGFALSLAAGYAFQVDPSLGEIASRTSINLGDVVLAFAAGVAGALSMTRGVSSALIGVMVAVALMPPLVAGGMLLGAGHEYLAYRAFLLLVTNISAINLASVVTFLILGLRPISWHVAEKAKRTTWFAIALWVLLLGILVTAILLS